MKEKIIKNIFSLTGASITIGAVGFISGIVTLFIDVNSQISIKWLLFVVLISVTFILILLKIIYDQFNETIPLPPFEHPIRYVPEEKVFVIRRNDNFLNSIIVGCYAKKDEIDRLAYLGVVHLVQEKVVQIKLRADLGVYKEIPTTQEELSNLLIRPVVPIEAIDQLNDLEK